MTSVPLDPKKLLGFKLIQRKPAEHSSATSIKLGIKGDVQLGAKVGGKVGIKTARLAPRG
jgi:hypothetical protein